MNRAEGRSRKQGRGKKQEAERRAQGRDMAGAGASSRWQELLAAGAAARACADLLGFANTCRKGLAMS